MTASNHGERLLSKRPYMHARAGLGTRQRWRSHLGSMARGGAHSWPTAKALPTHDGMPLHHLRCPAAGQPHEARRSGIDRTRTGLIHVGAGLICIV